MVRNSASAVTVGARREGHGSSPSVARWRTLPRIIFRKICGVGQKAVGEAAVVGMPDERLGEVGIAFVVRRADNDIEADELMKWCRERMANYKVPKRVEFVTELPRNASGKVQKFALKQRIKH